ncbi:MAG: dihydrodipicolinate synthase family protein [Bacteroidia bacterium]
MKNLKGTGVALVTPFLKSGKIDFGAIDKLLIMLVKGGVNYLVVMGTTGGSLLLFQVMRKKSVLEYILKVNKNRSFCTGGLWSRR